MSTRGDAIRLEIAVPAQTIDEVIASMQRIDAELDENDGVASFNRLYLAVTEAVHQGLGRVEFEDRAFLGRLDVVFANLYLQALVDWEAGREPPGAWRPLFDERWHPSRRPIQFAFCGMNAHINHDLPQAITLTCKELGTEPSGDSPQHRDFARVNDLLRKVEAKEKSQFVRGFVAVVCRALGKEADQLAMWSIADARELAWRHGELLWKLRDHAELEKAYLETLAGLAEIGGRGILV